MGVGGDPGRGGGHLRLDPARARGELRGELPGLERELRLEHRGQREQLGGGQLLQQAQVHLPGLRGETDKVGDMCIIYQTDYRRQA